MARPTWTPRVENRAGSVTSGSRMTAIAGLSRSAGQGDARPDEDLRVDHGGGDHVLGPRAVADPGPQHAVAEDRAGEREERQPADPRDRDEEGDRERAVHDRPRPHELGLHVEEARAMQRGRAEPGALVGHLRGHRFCAGRLSGRGPTIRLRWTRASWASSTSRPTRSPTAASGSTFDHAVERARALIAEGADILDIGGESTRPRAEPVGGRRGAAPRRPRRAAPCAAPACRSASTPRSSTVAEAAVDAGATFVNDVTAFRQEPELAGFVADRGCDCCLMHMLGEPRTMQDDPRYDDVVDDVARLPRGARRVRGPRGRARGAHHGRPGHRLRQDARAQPRAPAPPGPHRRRSGFPVVIGTSRKSFLGRLTGRDDPHDRVAATVATTVLALERGASVFRVHDVAPTKDALAVATATLRADGP